MALDRATKLRWRRRLRRGQRQVEDLGVQAGDNLEKQLFERLSRLAKVRRFIASWVILFVLLVTGVLLQARALGKYYLSPQPDVGGIYTEGIVGTFTNANPLYSASAVDNSVERLVFSGLFKFNQQNELVGDLAETFALDERGTTYTVRLKENLTWHDGMPLTAADVAYTYAMIQNPDAKSPLASSWQGISVTAVDERTITFMLPSILSAFPYSMINGIVPKHLLSGIPAGQLRSSTFNTNNPVGSGPFKWEAIEVLGGNSEEREQRIALVPNPGYVGGQPKLDKLIIRTYLDEKQLIDATKDQEVNGASGITSVPQEIKDIDGIREYNVPLTSQVMVFFKNTSELFSDPAVRRGLSLAVNTKEVLSSVERPLLPSDSPLLQSHIGYDKSATQRTNNKPEAERILDEAGWVVGGEGMRFKNGAPLSFVLTTQSNSVYERVANELKEQWKEVGVNVEVVPQKDEDLQSSLAVHNYDALLYGISLGPDPDVFAYWHSTQADLRSPTRLNFAEYSSGAADRALEGGRTRSDDTVRAIKYKPFLDAWVNDAPAIALYQPRFLYVSRDPLFNFDPSGINTASDRFNNVENWMIRRSDQPMR